MLSWPCLWCAPRPSCLQDCTESSHLSLVVSCVYCDYAHVYYTLLNYLLTCFVLSSPHFDKLLQKKTEKTLAFLYFLTTVFRNSRCLKNKLIHTWSSCCVVNLLGTWVSPCGLKRSPWLVWLSGLRASLPAKGLPVWFPDTCVVGQVPSRWHSRGNHTLVFLSLSFSLPSSLSKNK